MEFFSKYIQVKDIEKYFCYDNQVFIWPIFIVKSSLNHFYTFL